MRGPVSLALVLVTLMPAVTAAQGSVPMEPDVPAWAVVSPGSTTACGWPTGTDVAAAIGATDPEIVLAPSSGRSGAGTPFEGALVSGSAKRVKRAPFVRVLAPLDRPAAIDLRVSLDETGGWFDHATGIADALGVRAAYDALALAQLRDRSSAFSGWVEAGGCGVGVEVDRAKRLATITFRPLWDAPASLAGPVPERVPAADGEVTACAWITGEALMAAYTASDGYAFAPDPDAAGTPRAGSMFRSPDTDGGALWPVITVNTPFDRAADVFWGEGSIDAGWQDRVAALGDLLGVADPMAALVAQAEAAGDAAWTGAVEVDGCLLGLEQTEGPGFIFVTARPIWSPAPSPAPSRSPAAP